MKTKRLCLCGHEESDHIGDINQAREWCLGAEGIVSPSCKCQEYRPGLKLRKKK